MEYGSRNVANTALGLSIGGTALGLINGAGGLMNLFGGGPRQPVDPGDRPVTRYEMDLHQQNTAKDIIIAKLEGQKYTDAAAASLQAEIGQQAVLNATQAGFNNLIQAQIAQLMSMTKTYIPSANIAFPSPVPTTGDDVASTGSGT